MGYIEDRYNAMAPAAQMQSGKGEIKVATLTGNDRINEARTIQEIEKDGYTFICANTYTYVTNRSDKELATKLYFRKYLK